MNEYFKIFIISCISLCLGIFIGSKSNLQEKDDKNLQSQSVNQKVESKTETKVVYVPKYVDASGVKEKTDIETNIGKPTLNLKINGKETEFKKSDDERFIFDKNKIVLDQNSTIMIETKVDPVKIDKTKYWGIGAGYGSNVVGIILTFPIDKKKNLNGWMYADEKKKRGGIILRF